MTLLVQPMYDVVRIAYMTYDQIKQYGDVPPFPITKAAIPQSQAQELMGRMADSEFHPYRVGYALYYPEMARQYR